MAIKDVLPDRRLTFDEFQEIQQMDPFDAVYTSDSPGKTDVLILQRDDTEHTLHYTDEESWHICETKNIGADSSANAEG